MALTSTMHAFRLEISDIDRGVYDTVDLRVARHPSESVPFLITRVLAYALEYRPELAFGRGVSTADEPAIWARDATGRILLWVDIGSPSTDRLHKASKLADEVVVYTTRDIDGIAASAVSKGVHRAEALRLVEVPNDIVTPLGDRLGRRNDWGLVRTEGSLFVTAEAGDGFEGRLRQRTAS
ncbi:MAG: YaeQ family protein [Myxococcales bacterium]|nr:YaeQ family protein [Myxococcales bacterium]